MKNSPLLLNLKAKLSNSLNISGFDLKILDSSFSNKVDGLFHLQFALTKPSDDSSLSDFLAIIKATHDPSNPSTQPQITTSLVTPRISGSDNERDTLTAVSVTNAVISLILSDYCKDALLIDMKHYSNEMAQKNKATNDNLDKDYSKLDKKSAYKCLDVIIDKTKRLRGDTSVSILRPAAIFFNLYRRNGEELNSHQVGVYFDQKIKIKVDGEPMARSYFGYFFEGAYRCRDTHTTEVPPIKGGRYRTA